MARRVAPRHEDGQSLVFVLLSLLVLIAVFALVVDVGSWIRAQRQAQVVADAAALAGAQKLLDSQADADTDARYYAQLNWPGVDVDVSPAAGSIAVDLQHDAPGLFSRLVGLFNVTVGAHATARIEVPTELNAIAPLALECPGSCNPNNGPPWNLGDWDTFMYDRRNFDLDDSTIVPIRLPGVSTSTFALFVSCDAYTPNASDCNQTIAEAETDYPWLSRRASQVRNAIQNAESKPHLVAIYDDESGGDYNVVGWAVAYLTVESWGFRWVRVRATFQRLLVKSAWMSSNGTGGQWDFGVRTVGLTR